MVSAKCIAFEPYVVETQMHNISKFGMHTDHGW